MSAWGDRGVERDTARLFIPGLYGAGGFQSIEDIERSNDAAGLHFFSAGARRWFSSRIGTALYGGRFFVTSEQDRGPGPRAWNGERRYSVRFARCDSSIETVGEFGGYGTSRAANNAAARAAALFAIRAGAGKGSL